MDNGKIIILTWCFFYLVVFLSLILSKIYEKLAFSKDNFSKEYTQESINWVSFKVLKFIPATGGAPIILTIILILALVGIFKDKGSIEDIMIIFIPFIFFQIFLWGYKHKLKKEYGIFDSFFRKVLLLVSFSLISNLLILLFLHEFSGFFQSWCNANSYPGNCFSLGILFFLLACIISPILLFITVVQYLISKRKRIF